jgi:hypothetical protein
VTCLHIAFTCILITARRSFDALLVHAALDYSVKADHLTHNTYIAHQAVLAAARKLQKLSEAAGSAGDGDTAMQRAAAAAGLDWQPTNDSSNSNSNGNSSGSAQAIAAARTKLAVLLQLGVVSDSTTDSSSSTAADSTNATDADDVNSSSSASSSSGAAVSRKDMQQRMELLGMVTAAAAATAVAGGASEDRVAAETCWLDGARYIIEHTSF